MATVALKVARRVETLVALPVASLSLCVGKILKSCQINKIPNQTTTETNTKLFTPQANIHLFSSQEVSFSGAEICIFTDNSHAWYTMYDSTVGQVSDRFSPCCPSI